VIFTLGLSILYRGMGRNIRLPGRFLKPQDLSKQLPVALMMSPSTSEIVNMRPRLRSKGISSVNTCVPPDMPGKTGELLL